MNINLVKDVSSNFVEKYLENSQELKENVSQFLMASIQQMRREDNNLYDEISDLPISSKIALLESRLEMEILPFNIISETMTSGLTKSYEKVLEGYGDDPDISEYNEEIFSEVLQEFREMLSKFKFSRTPELDDGVTNDQKNKLWEAVKYFAKKLPTIGGLAALGSMPAMGGAWFLSLAALFGIMSLTGAITMTTKLNLHKEQLELLNDVADIIHAVASKLKDGTENIKYRYLLTFKNEEKCYKMAGLDPQRLGLRHFLTIKDGGMVIKTIRQLIWTENLDKLEMLRNCYLENFLDRISIFFDLYFDCLRKSGNWNSVRALNDDKFIQMFRLQGGLYPACDEYRMHATEAIKTYEKLVNFLFDESPQKRVQWILLLNRYILDRRESQDQQLETHRATYDKSKQPQFKTDKYRKMGSDL